MVTLFLIKEAKIYNEESQSLQGGSGETGQLHVKEIRTLPNTIHKNKVKMD